MLPLKIFVPPMHCAEFVLSSNDKEENIKTLGRKSLSYMLASFI